MSEDKSWCDEKFLAEVRRVLQRMPKRLPGAGRTAVEAELGVTSYKAREAIRRIDEEFTWDYTPTFCVWDIETTGLKGDFGRLLCCSMMTLPGGEMTTYKWTDFSKTYNNDGKLAAAIRDKIEEHDFSAGYFSKGFDFGFLQARLAANGKRLLDRHLHIDPIWHFRGWRGLKIGSSSMKNVASFFGLDEQKMDVPKDVWVAANAGDLEALEILVERCESDVRVTAKLLKKALELRLVKNVQSYP